MNIYLICVKGITLCSNHLLIMRGDELTVLNMIVDDTLKESISYEVEVVKSQFSLGQKFYLTPNIIAKHFEYK